MSALHAHQTVTLVRLTLVHAPSVCHHSHTMKHLIHALALRASTKLAQTLALTALLIAQHVQTQQDCAQVVLQLLRKTRLQLGSVAVFQQLKLYSMDNAFRFLVVVHQADTTLVTIPVSTA